MCIMIYSLQNNFKFMIAFVSDSPKEVGSERSFHVWDGENETQTQSSWCPSWAEVPLSFILHSKVERSVL